MLWLPYTYMAAKQACTVSGAQEVWEILIELQGTTNSLYIVNNHVWSLGCIELWYSPIWFCKLSPLRMLHCIVSSRRSSFLVPQH